MVLKHEDRWGDAWVNYKFGNYDTRLILISKQLHKKNSILKRQNGGLFRETLYIIFSLSPSPFSLR